MLSRRIATIAHNETEGKRVDLILFSNYQENEHWIEDEDHNEIAQCKGLIDAIAIVEHLYRGPEWALEIIAEGYQGRGES